MMSQIPPLRILLFLGDSPLAPQVFERAVLLCKAAIPEEHFIEVLELSEDADLVDEYDVVATPCLIFSKGARTVKVVGDLSKTEIDRALVELLDGA